MKTTNCYIKGIIIEKLGKQDEDSFHMYESKSIGETVEYPTSQCALRPEDKKVIIPYFDEYGSSAIILDNIEVVYKEEEMSEYIHWKHHFS